MAGHSTKRLCQAIAPQRCHEVEQEGLVSGEVGASHARRGGNLMLGFPLKSFGELRLRLFFCDDGIDPRSRAAPFNVS